MLSGVLVELVESRGLSVDGEELSALTGRDVERYRDFGRRFSLIALYANVSRRHERMYSRHGTNDAIVVGRSTLCSGRKFRKPAPIHAARSNPGISQCDEMGKTSGRKCNSFMTRI